MYLSAGSYATLPPPSLSNIKYDRNESYIHSIDTVRLASTLFSHIFTGEGTIKYMDCDSTEHRGKRLEQQP
jgi:hypothetical protein